MTSELTVLCATAALVGVTHTLLGPDHYVPFAVMAKTRAWSLRRTIVITMACGLGHILSSVLLGAVGIIIGTTVLGIESIQSIRGEISGWLLIFFGLIYMAWGVKHAGRRKPHRHLHVHEDGTIHNHTHVHDLDHVHVHDEALSDEMFRNTRRSLAPWALFVIFLFGPCEFLIPFLMYPAAEGHLVHAVIVAAVFGLATIVTMVALVLVVVAGFQIIPPSRLERHGHSFAGFAILACGIAVTIGL